MAIMLPARRSGMAPSRAFSKLIAEATGSGAELLSILLSILRTGEACGCKWNVKQRMRALRMLVDRLCDKTVAQAWEEMGMERAGPTTLKIVLQITPETLPAAKRILEASGRIVEPGVAVEPVHSARADDAAGGVPGAIDV